jgi:elongation factor Ts
MTKIAAQDVKRLREVTGAGMMDCKKALAEAGGDFDAAIDILRKKGQKVSAKRADREANEGFIASRVTDAGDRGVLVEVNCETDFVARNQEFVSFAEEVAELALAAAPDDIDALLGTRMKSGRTVGETVTDLVGKIGEKIDVRRFATVKSGAGRIIAYLHPGSKLGVLVEVSGDGNLAAVGRDIAMQVAAMNPVATTREEVPSDIQDKELEIGREIARNEGKPEQIIDKIAQGKLERFYKDNVLVEQPFVKEASTSVKEMLKKQGVEVVRFARFALGD